MWSDIFATNGDEVGRALRDLCSELEQSAHELEQGGSSATRVLELLAAARALRGR
jgi:hypothetical protein